MQVSNSTLDLEMRRNLIKMEKRAKQITNNCRLYQKVRKNKREIQKVSESNIYIRSIYRPTTQCMRWSFKPGIIDV